ncbi:MAG: Snf7 family protein [Desulfurococcaceae archaeon]
MMENIFGKKDETIGEKFKQILRGGDKEPIEKKVILAHYKVKGSISRIDGYIGRLEQRDKELFQTIIDSLIKRDDRRAKMYAREVAEIRKISKQLLTVRYALEQVALKLETFLVFGGAISDLNQIVGIMREAVNITKPLAPDVWIDLQYALKELETSLTAGLVGFAAELDVGLDTEAKKVLEEAKLAAEQSIKERYAELPKLLGEEVKDEAKATT